MSIKIMVFEKKAIHLTVNGNAYDLLVSPNDTLLDTLRNQLSLTGTKHGCGTGDCCACTVLVNDKPMLACLSLAADLDGDEVTTIEGLSKGSQLHPIQNSFIEKGAVQCGFCTPGMIMVTKSLLDEDPNPSEEKARQYLRGNLCRCTGYTKILDALLDAAGKMQGEK